MPLAAVMLLALTADAIRAVSASDVKVLDAFWTTRGEMTRGVSLPPVFELPGSLNDPTAIVAAEHGAFRAGGDARHLDLVEHVLYNLAGNVDRVPALIYAQDDKTVFVGLFVASEARVRIGAASVRLTQRTNYPWDGDIELRVEPETRAAFTVAVRIPGWARGRAIAGDRYRFWRPDVPSPTLIVNGEAVRSTLSGGFARVTREWRSGDVIHIYFPMPVHRVLAQPSRSKYPGRAALQRGPLVYAIEREAADEPVVPLDTAIEHGFRAALLGGVEVLTAPNLLAVPYYASADRGRDRLVWLSFELQRRESFAP